MNKHEFGEKFALSFCTGLLSGGVVVWFTNNPTVSFAIPIIIGIIGLVIIYKHKAKKEH